MDAGYYGASGGPFIFTYTGTGTSADFPTMADSGIPGPFTRDVDQFWIGPLFGFTSDDDIPSIEQDADDPADPDRVPNLNLPAGKADCDRENGTHNPAGTGCQPVRPFSIPMNARLVIAFGYPPLGIWITAVHASESMTYSGPIYWNLLVDLNQDGSWGNGEWIARDVNVSLAPGETKVLVSPPFRFPAGNTPWGRLNFPFWVRSTVTSEKVEAVVGTNSWDGRGVEEGFQTGEVEDYFVEWQPIGQRFPGGEPMEETGCRPELAAGLEQYGEIITYPESTFEFTPIQTESIQMLGILDTNNGSPAVVFDPFLVASSAFLEMMDDGFEVKVTTEPNMGVYVHPMAFPGEAPAPGLLFLQSPMEDQPCQGTGQVQVQTGAPADFYIPEEPGGLGMFGVWLFESVIKDGEEHHPFIMMLETFRALARDGSITFEADPPWVTVSGELEEDGSFYTEGIGTVAGYTNTSVTFEGSIQDGTLTGEYTMGAGGELPGGFPIVYGITGTYEGPAEAEPPEPRTGLSEGEQEAASTFVSAFNQAFIDQDPETLYTLLDPAVISRYGKEACEAYLDTVVQTPTDISVLEIEYTGPWTWERDGISEEVNWIYSVLVEFNAAGGTTNQELHLSMPGDNSVRWFTDCGDPLPQE